MSRTWPSLLPLPSTNVALIDPVNGRMTKDCYRYFASLDRIMRDIPTLSLNDLANVDAGSPSNGDVLTFVTANNTWEPT